MSEEAGAPQPVSVLAKAAFVAGGAGLLLAMACDAAAVVGRHIGVPLLGSIEIVQSCIVLIASMALIGATLARAHAGVHILTERLGPRWRAWLIRFADLASALFCAALLIGSAWLVWDLRAGHERTEVLHLPVVALRAVWCVAVSIALTIFALRVVRGTRKP